MIGWLRLVFREPKIGDLIGSTRRVKVMGVYFRIKKVDPLAFLDGSNAVQQIYDTYHAAEGAKPLDAVAAKRVRSHMRDVLLAGIVEPRFARDAEKAAPGEIPVDDLFQDWMLADALFWAIHEYTYGKKKPR